MIQLEDSDQLGQRLRLLSPVRFAALANALLRRLVAEAGIPSSHLHLTLNVSDPDGGVDAELVDSPVVGGRLIPKSGVVYQYRSGSTPRSANRIATDDILDKSGVVRALESGKGFVYLTSQDPSSLWQRILCAFRSIR